MRLQKKRYSLSTFASASGSLAPCFRIASDPAPAPIRPRPAPADENKALGRALQVTGLPTVLLFRGEAGEVERLSPTLSKLQLLK